MKYIVAMLILAATATAALACPCVPGCESLPERISRLEKEQAAGKPVAAELADARAYQRALLRPGR